MNEDLRRPNPIFFLYSKIFVSISSEHFDYLYFVYLNSSFPFHSILYIYTKKIQKISILSLSLKKILKIFRRRDSLSSFSCLNEEIWTKYLSVSRDSNSISSVKRLSFSVCLRFEILFSLSLSLTLQNSKSRQVRCNDFSSFFQQAWVLREA